MKNSIDLIQVTGLGKTYNEGCPNEKKALADINLTIKSGELIAITGRSGAGKTTLLNILGCLDVASSGEYIFNGKSMHNLKEDELAKIRRQYFGIITQDPLLIESLSAFDNVKLPTYLIKQKNDTRNKNTANILKSLGIYDLAEQRVSTMSGGERQRVVIARAIVNEPLCVLADEPTGSLDNYNKNIVMSILKNISSSGKTVILITHDMEIANECNRIIRLDDGYIKEEDTQNT